MTDKPKLTDAIVLEMRKVCRGDRRKSAKYHSDKLGISKSIIDKALRGLTFKHLDKIEAPIVRSNEILSDEDVIKIRKDAHETGQVDTKALGELYDMSPQTIEKMLRGTSYERLNEIAPPYFSWKSRRGFKDQARELYNQGLSYNQIVERLGVSKCSVSLWCRDLREAKAAALAATKAKTIKPAPRTCRGNLLPAPRPLSDDTVIKLRQQVKHDGAKNLRLHAERLGVSINSISNAITGKSYPHVNEREAPVTERLRPKRQTEGKPEKHAQLISELLALRRSDPETWTYQELAKKASEITGKSYRPNHVFIALRSRDPSIVELGPIVIPKPKKGYVPKPKVPKVKIPRVKKPKVPKPRPTYELECVMCEETFTSSYKHREVCPSKQCQDILREGNNRERRLLLSQQKESEDA